MASVYCVRSLVPMEKKSASFANCAAITAVTGTSTMMPAGIGAMPSRCDSSARIAFASRISCSDRNHREHHAHATEG